MVGNRARSLAGRGLLAAGAGLFMGVMGWLAAQAMDEFVASETARDVVISIIAVMVVAGACVVMALAFRPKQPTPSVPASPPRDATTAPVPDHPGGTGMTQEQIDPGETQWFVLADTVSVDVEGLLRLVPYIDLNYRVLNASAYSLQMEDVKGEAYAYEIGPISSGVEYHCVWPVQSGHVLNRAEWLDVCVRVWLTQPAVEALRTAVTFQLDLERLEPLFSIVGHEHVKIPVRPGYADYSPPQPDSAGDVSG